MNKIFLICTNSKTINTFFLKQISKILEKNECIILTENIGEIKLNHKRITDQNKVFNHVEGFFSLSTLT